MYLSDISDVGWTADEPAIVASQKVALSALAMCLTVENASFFVYRGLICVFAT